MYVTGIDFTDKLWDRDHSLVFRVDTNGDNVTDFSVSAVELLTGVYPGEGYINKLCDVSVTRTTSGAHVTAPTSCLGSPSQVWVQALLMSSQDTCGYRICMEYSYDWAPGEAQYIGGPLAKFSGPGMVSQVAPPTLTLIAPPTPPVNHTIVRRCIHGPRPWHGPDARRARRRHRRQTGDRVRHGMPSYLRQFRVAAAHAVCGR